MCASTLFETPPHSFHVPRSSFGAPIMKKSFKSYICEIFFFGATFLMGVPSALAQDYPTKPIRLVVPFPPGGGTDFMARVIMQKVGEGLGGTVVVENRGGAGSSIGTDIVAKSPADGYTLLIVSGAHAINPSIYPKLPYDSVRD